MTGCMDGQGGFCTEQNHTAKPNLMVSIDHFDDSGPDRIIIMKSSKNWLTCVINTLINLSCGL